MSTSNGGFLRKVTSTQQVSDTFFIFTTENASLADVIKQGSLTLNKQLTRDDIDTFEILPELNDAATRANALRKNRAVLAKLRNLPDSSSTVMLETATKGVYIKRTDDPAVFSFVLLCDGD